MATTRQPTVHELSDKVDDLRKEMQDFRMEVRSHFKDYMPRELYTAQHQNLVDDVKNTRAIAMWSLGLVCGLVISALVAFVSQIGGG